MRIKNRSEGYVRRNKTLYVLWGDKGKLILRDALGNEPHKLQSLQSNLCTTVTLGEWQGDRNIQGNRYTQGSYIEVWLYLQKLLASIFVFVLAEFCRRYWRWSIEFWRFQCSEFLCVCNINYLVIFLDYSVVFHPSHGLIPPFTSYLVHCLSVFFISRFQIKL